MVISSASGYHYADYYALDGPHSQDCPKTTCRYSLSDFFNFNQSAAQFTEINTPVANDGTVLDANYFMKYSLAPQPPDLDGQ